MQFGKEVKIMPVVEKKCNVIRLSVRMQNTWSGEIEDYDRVTHIAVKQVCEFITEENPFEHVLNSFRCDYVIALYFDEDETTFKLFNADKWEIRYQR